MKVDRGLNRFKTSNVMDKIKTRIGGIEIKIGGRSHPYITGGADSVPFCVLSTPSPSDNDSFLSDHIKIS